MDSPIGSGPCRVVVKTVLRATAFLIAVALCKGTGDAAQAPRFMGYLSIEANEGDSSGGHAAIRFGNEIFHFQNESPGILRIRRYQTAAFHHAYAMLGNRAIRELRIAVSDDTYNLLRDAFARLLMVQDAQMEVRDSLAADTALLTALLRQYRDPCAPPHAITLTLKGLGYFLPDAPPGPEAGVTTGAIEISAGTQPSPALVSLRDRIRAVYGERFISEKLDRARAMLHRMAPRAVGTPLPDITRDTFPPFKPSVAARYRDNLQAIVALELLQAAPALRPGTFLAAGDAFRLEPHEALILRRFALQLENDLISLADSPRSDWGLPFILGMARLAAIEASLASGRIVLLDIFPRDDGRATHGDTGLRPYLPLMEREMREIFIRKRRAFFAAGNFREAGYATMERAGNNLLAIDRAMATGITFAGGPEESFPARGATISAPLPLLPDKAVLERELAAARAAERDYATALKRLYSYDLVSRNCVTELFEVINQAIARQATGPEYAGRYPAADPVAALRAESARRLGGFVDPSQGLVFIPFVSAMKVESSYAVAAERDIPSYRTARLAEMYGNEAPLRVFLRESNTITSTVYRPVPGDSAFIFFTDGAPPLRPLFGAFNLVAGLAEGVAGLLTMPVEGPDRFLAGTKGVLFSLPELVFVNLRKGSMAYVEQTERDDSQTGMPAD